MSEETYIKPFLLFWLNVTYSCLAAEEHIYSIKKTICNMLCICKMLFLEECYTGSKRD